MAARSARAARVEKLLIWLFAPLAILASWRPPVFAGGMEVRGLGPEVAAEAARHERELVAIMERATERELPRRERTLVIEEATDLRAHDAGASSLGRIRLRKGAHALRHEVAHQVLLEVCPQASGDKLFHEAFALATSGELEAWLDDGYFSSVKAEKILRSGTSLDGREARRALARLVADGRGSDPLPRSLTRRLRTCTTGAPWAPMRVEELSSPAEAATGDAFVLLSRHSGEVLAQSGEVDLQMPFGSTLKPFVVAGAKAAPPRLPVDRHDPLWRCGERLPAEMGAGEALARSCNAYFLRWAKDAPALAGYGGYGEVLLALGLERLPAQIDEAIGLRPTLALSPWQLAQAYRVLAAARPDVVAMLGDTAKNGTLGDLPVSSALGAYALKTGTVRDPRNNVELGWIIAVAPDWIAVMAAKGKMPRTFAERFAARVMDKQPGALAGRARVQVFALLDPADVQAECAGVPIQIERGEVSVSRRGFVALGRLREQVLCLGRPFSVRFPGIAPRLYAGSFERSSAPRVPEDTPRARRGSDVVFSTTLARYVAGVLASEDAVIDGEARRALARVIAHNEAHGSERHPGRPVCDTTHCQVFQGTPRETRVPRDLEALAPWLARRGWLPFSRGGHEAWREERPLARVSAALGEPPRALRFAATELSFAAWNGEVEEWRTISCERLRGPLKLPACPERAELGADSVRFFGVGAGHGLGLDVEAAKASRLGAEALLERAYHDQKRSKEAKK